MAAKEKYSTSKGRKKRDKKHSGEAQKSTQVELNEPKSPATIAQELEDVLHSLFVMRGAESMNSSPSSTFSSVC